MFVKGFLETLTTVHEKELLHAGYIKTYEKVIDCAQTSVTDDFLIGLILYRFKVCITGFPGV